MELAAIGELGTSFLSYALPFLFVLTVVIYFHELGHFLVARWCGVRVETFSVGFGRELAGWTDRRGTRWKIGWIPLGGYVKFQGDENAASMPDRQDEAALRAPDSFHAKSIGARAAIVAAGPIANFILAVVIFAVMFTLVGRPIMAPLVDEVEAGSVAEAAGFLAGDRVVTIDGAGIESFSDIQRIVGRSAGVPLAVTVERDGAAIELDVTPELREVEGAFGTQMRIGVLGVRRSASSDTVEMRRYDPASAMVLAVSETYNVIGTTLSYVARVIVGSESADQLGGPIRIVQISGEAANLGMMALVNLAALLSVSIGLINLFPIPMLDGGHLVYYAIEALRGRPLSAAVQDMGFRIGLALVLMLMLFATWNDLVQLDVF
jgi:regulator of sigma E protease